MTEYRFGNIERIYVPDENGVTSLYLTRLHLGHLFIHFFNRGDMDRHPHDHPWDFWTFPLTTYYEEVWEIANALCHWNVLVTLKTLEEDSDPGTGDGPGDASAGGSGSDGP